MALDPFSQMQQRAKRSGYDPLAFMSALGVGETYAAEQRAAREREKFEAEKAARQLELEAQKLEQQRMEPELRRQLELEKLGIQATQAEKEQAVRRELAGMELAGRKELTGMELAGRRDLSQEELAARRQMAADEAMARLGMTREEIQARRDLAKEEAQLRRDLATQESQLRRDITGLEIQGRKDIAAQEAGAALDRLQFQSAQQRLISREEQDRQDARTNAELRARFNLQEAQLAAQTEESRKQREARKEEIENSLVNNPTDIARILFAPNALTGKDATPEEVQSRARSLADLFPGLREKLRLAEPTQAAAPGAVPTVDPNKVKNILDRF